MKRGGTYLLVKKLGIFRLSVCLSVWKEQQARRAGAEDGKEVMKEEEKGTYL